MAHLVKIGNSQGVRIPKALIEQAHLEGKELRFELFENGLLIAPERKHRKGWADSIKKILLVKGEEPLNDEWLDPSLTSDEELEW